LELKLFHRTQRDLATAINQTIDSYWNDHLSEQELIDSIKALHEHNQNKLLNEKGFTTIIQQQCGKRRLDVVKKILGVE
jgi:uncharacterized protein (TIGR04540 family)